MVVVTIIHKFSLFLGKELSSQNKENIELIAYAIESITANIINLTIIFLIASFANLRLEYLIFIFSSGAIRQFTGGHHAKNNISCVLQYIIVSFIFIVLSTKVPDNYTLALMMVSSTFVSMLVLKYAPISMEEHPIMKKNKNKLRYMCLFVTALVSIVNVLFIYLGYTRFSKVISFAIFMQSISMLSIIIKNKKEAF